MKALSIRQPWAWLIVNGHKPIENRSWRTTYRGKFLIHASQSVTYREYSDVVTCIEMFSGGNHIAVPALQDLERGGIVGISSLVDCVSHSDSSWFMGPNGFVLRDSSPLPFIPMKGRLSFFETNITPQLLEC